MFCFVLLEDKRQWESDKVKNESEEERNIRLEEQRHRNSWRLQPVAQNPAQTYKDALNYAIAINKALRLFNSVCIHCGVLHYLTGNKASKDDLLRGCYQLGLIAFLC